MEISFLKPIYLDSKREKSVAVQFLEFCDSCFYLGRSYQSYEVQYDPINDCCVNNVSCTLEQNERISVKDTLLKIVVWVSGFFVFAFIVKVAYRLSHKFQQQNDLTSLTDQQLKNVQILLDIPKKIREIFGNALSLLEKIEEGFILMEKGVLQFQLENYSLMLRPWGTNEVWMLDEKMDNIQPNAIGCHCIFHPFDKNPMPFETFIFDWLKRLAKGEGVGYIEGAFTHNAKESDDRSLHLVKFVA